MVVSGMRRRVLDELEHLPVSHNPAVRKRVIFKKGEMPTVTQIARATFPPGESAPGHSHADMWEVFVFESGVGEMEIDGVTHKLAAGDTFLIEPGEVHEIRNTGDGELVVTLIGVEG